MLRSIHAEGVGPSSPMDVDLGERVNVFTGDNGLGKTFLLDLLWMVCTDITSRDLLPAPGAAAAEVRGVVAGGNAHTADKTFAYQFDLQSWSSTTVTSGLAPLCLYARVDGSVSVWDPARSSSASGVPSVVSGHRFTPADILNGLTVGEDLVCNGMIRDVVDWQRQGLVPGSSDNRFEALTAALSRLAPDAEPLEFGVPRRLRVGDAREHPTLRLPEGSVPVTHSSAAYQRILGLAYLVVWSWHEHLAMSTLTRRPPTRGLVLLVDEVEAHLHPRWQRRIVPALLDAAAKITGCDVQLVFTTHAPLVLASLETWFRDETDRLLVLERAAEQVTLERVAWFKRGDVVDWLTDPTLFGLEQARSLEAEEAIEAAEAFMRGDLAELPRELGSGPRIDQALRRALAPDDHFWPRWIARSRDAS